MVESQSFLHRQISSTRDARSQEVFQDVPLFRRSLFRNPSLFLLFRSVELLPWAMFGGLLMLLAIYFVGAEQGATALIHGRYVHEFVHDGRHLLGFPCH